MRVMLITYGTYMDFTQVVSGNTVRAYYLARGLAHHGIEVIHVHPRFLGEPDPAEESRREIAVCTYDGPEGLAKLIAEQRPDALLVGYWELLNALPDGLDIPIVLDVVAPRVLEVMFQGDHNLEEEIRRMLALYRKADRFLAGNRRQSHFLLPWLIMAGFDCRHEAPIDVVPISTVANDGAGGKQEGPRRFVSGGVAWPWRKTERYFDALVKELDRAGHGDELVLFAGKYVYAGGDDDLDLTPVEAQWPESVVKRHPLQPYGKMGEYLADRCDVGIELAEQNIEREYSQSFRAVEFLRNGLPLVCNSYIEMAGLVREFDAGWIIDSPEELPGILAEIAASPDTLREKSRNALELVNQRFDYRKTVEPIVAFLKNPKKPVRGPWLMPDEAPQQPVRPPGLRDRLRGKAVRLLRTLMNRGTPDTGAVAIITRSDVFPADHGAAVKIDRTAWGLSHHVSTVYLITDDRRRYYAYISGKMEERHYPLWLTLLGPSRRRVRGKLVEKTGIPEADVFLYYPLADWSFILRTLYLAGRYGIRIFQSEFPAYARACIWGRRVFGGKTLMVEHNVEYQRLRDQSPDMGDHTFRLLRDVETGLARQMDAVITVSDPDRDRLVQDGVDYRQVHTIPHGVDLASFDDPPCSSTTCSSTTCSSKTGSSRDQLFPDHGGRPILVYHGIYLYPPNMEAMEIMAREILPRLRAMGVNPLVAAIGRNAPENSPDPDIVFTGSVESVAPYLKQADLAVVPLMQGGGTRMKILDYFASGLPVVSTSKGIEGIPVQNGVHAMISDDFDAFAGHIAALLADANSASAMGRAGRGFVESLDWRSITARYKELMV